MPSGPVAQALKKGQGIFNDPQSTSAWVVTLPEQLPVTESLELVAGFERTKVAVGGLFLNRCIDDPFTTEELNRLHDYIENKSIYGTLTLKRLKAAIKARERLAAGTQLPIISVPQLDGLNNQELVERLVHRLAETEQTHP